MNNQTICKQKNTFFFVQSSVIATYHFEIYITYGYRRYVFFSFAVGQILAPVTKSALKNMGLCVLSTFRRS